MCEGKTLTTTGTLVFQGKSFNQVQASDDLDNDGLKNGDEIQVKNLMGRLYVSFLSLPLIADSDKDGLIDSDDSHPLIWDVGDRDLAIFAALAYEDGTEYINKNYTTSDIIGKPDVNDPLNNGESYYFLDYASVTEVNSKWKIVSYTNEKAAYDSYFSATTFKNGKEVQMKK